MFLAGIQRLGFWLFDLKSKSFRSSSGRAGYLSLLVQREVTRRKHAPEHCALRTSCPKGSRQRPGSANCTSVCNSGIGAIHRAAPDGPNRPLPPQCNGAPGRARARASCAQKPKKGRGVVGARFIAPGFAFDLVPSFDPGVPVSRVERVGREKPRSGASRRRGIRPTRRDALRFSRPTRGERKLLPLKVKDAKAKALDSRLRGNDEQKPGAMNRASMRESGSAPRAIAEMMSESKMNKGART